MRRRIALCSMCGALAMAAFTASAVDVTAPGAPASPGEAAPPGAAAEARIPFANHGGIYNWRAVDDKTLLIESQSRKWYKATLLSSCWNLPFAERVGFESNPDGSFDKFSAIEVGREPGRQRCQLISLVETTPPAKKSKDKKPVAAPPPQATPGAGSS
jgi:hypothetical protein